MIKTIDFHIDKLDSMKKYPDELFYIGDTSLLDKPLVSIVGSRKPNQYANQYIHKIASKLSQNGTCIVSGGAIGIDTIAHKAAGFDNTILVAGTGLDKRYPAINKSMIEQIEKQGLVLGQFSANTPSLPRNFPLRNELVVALGDVLIVAYADENSGTIRSVEYALKMGKDIYVLPHRLGQSEGTNRLLARGEAKAIYDIDKFLEKFGISQKKSKTKDDFLEYCKTNPTYDQAVFKYQNKVFEYELEAKIEVREGKIFVI